MSCLEKLGKGAPKGQEWFQHRRQTSILPRLLHVIAQERNIAVPEWRFFEMESTPRLFCMLHLLIWQHAAALKATVEPDAFLPLLPHSNGSALFPLLIIMKAFHYAGSYTANKQLGIQYCKCKLKCVFKARVRGEKLIKPQHTNAREGVGNSGRIIFGH